MLGEDLRMRNFPLYVTMQAFDGLGVRLPYVVAHPYTVHSTAGSHHHIANVLTSNGLISAANPTKQELGSHREVIRDSLSFLGPPPSFWKPPYCKPKAG